MAQHSWFRYVQRSVVLAVVLLTIAPSPGCTDERRVTSSGRPFSYELELLKEEESVGIESREKQPIPRLSSEPYVMLEEDIRQSGATDLPALLRRILGLDVPQATGTDANRVHVVVDGRLIGIDASDVRNWKDIPVTLVDIKRLEVSKEPASAVHGINSYDVVIKITTKTPAQ
jgi:outer membrane cobalamin receptor